MGRRPPDDARATSTAGRDAGYQFTPDWLLRNVNAVATGRAPFSALEDVSAAEFQDALGEGAAQRRPLRRPDRARPARPRPRPRADGPLRDSRDRAGYLHNRGGRFTDAAEADRALYWYVHAALRGRFAGSTETFLAKDLETVDKRRDRRRHRQPAAHPQGQPDRSTPRTSRASGRGSRSYPLLYLLARVDGASDLATGRPLGQDAAAVEVHEIFPQALLAKAGYSRAPRSTRSRTSRSSPRRRRWR